MAGALRCLNYLLGSAVDLFPRHRSCAARGSPSCICLLRSDFASWQHVVVHPAAESRLHAAHASCGTPQDFDRAVRNGRACFSRRFLRPSRYLITGHSGQLPSILGCHGRCPLLLPLLHCPARQVRQPFETPQPRPACSHHHARLWHPVRHVLHHPEPAGHAGHRAEPRPWAVAGLLCRGPPQAAIRISSHLTAFRSWLFSSRGPCYTPETVTDPDVGHTCCPRHAWPPLLRLRPRWPLLRL